jgi:uncharacterized oligopeptide transporter (OPT) family protein
MLLSGITVAGSFISAVMTCGIARLLRIVAHVSQDVIVTGCSFGELSWVVYHGPGQCMVGCRRFPAKNNLFIELTSCSQTQWGTVVGCIMAPKGVDRFWSAKPVGQLLQA